VLAGAPKLGKSAWVLNLSVAVATGGKAFGAFDVEAGDVVYATLEDGGYRRVQERLAKHLHDEPPPARLHLTANLHRLNDGGIQELDWKLYDLGGECRLVVIDTFQRVRPSETANRTKGWYEQDYEALASVTGLANRHNVSVVLVLHTREMKAADWIDAVSGTRGVTGAVDTILVADRGRGAADMVLRVTGRDIPEAEYAFDADLATYTWRYLGDATLAQLSDDRRSVFDTIEGPMTPTQVAAATGLKYDNVKKLMPRMADDGLIRNLGDGTYGPRKEAR
jgi:hypothetical protein